MERKRVNPNKIRAVGYDPKSRVLEVELRDGYEARSAVWPSFIDCACAAPCAGA